MRSLISTCTILLLAGCTIPHTGLYENPVRRNFREQYLAQHPSLNPEIHAAITSQRVIYGMNQMEVMAAWGPSTSCSRVLNDPRHRTVCLYTDKSTTMVLDRTYRDTSYKSVYFENGMAVDWQQH